MCSCDRIMIDSDLEHSLKRIEDFVTSKYDHSNFLDKKGLPDSIRRVQGMFTGELEIYDSSLITALGIDAEVKDQMILEFGAGGMSSSLDFLAFGSELVYVLEGFPFGFSIWEKEELNELLKLKSKLKGVDSDALILEERFVRGSERQPLPYQFDRSYFFFPDIVLLGNFPEKGESIWGKSIFNQIVLFAHHHLVQGGEFKVVTEIDIPYLSDVRIDGFEKSVERRSGRPLYSEEQRTSYDNDFERVRPASSLGLTIITYKKR